MEGNGKIILNGVEVDSDFTGIIEEKNGRIVKRNLNGDSAFDSKSGPGKSYKDNRKEEVGKITTAIVIAVAIVKLLLLVFN